MIGAPLRRIVLVEPEAPGLNNAPPYINRQWAKDNVAYSAWLEEVSAEAP